MDEEPRQDPGRATAPPSTIGSEAKPAGNVVASLLKAPLEVADAIEGNRRLVAHGMTLLAAAVAFHAVFGLAAGLFGGWQVAVMDVVKTPLIAVSSLLLCYPSLYVFACVGGTTLSLAQVFLLGSSALAMLGMLLVGLAPVAWLFSVSTESPGFMTMLVLFIWLIAVSFALKYITKLQARAIFRKAIGIKLWFLVLVIVTLQMVTYLRPLLVAPQGAWWTPEKKFFLTHFADTLDEGAAGARKNTTADPSVRRR
jgi:hypothetical protein